MLSGGKVVLQLLKNMSMTELLFELRAPSEPTRFDILSTGAIVSSRLYISLRLQVGDNDIARLRSCSSREWVVVITNQ